MKYPLSYVCTFFASNWASISTIAMHWRRQLHCPEIDFSLHLQSLVVSDPCPPDYAPGPPRCDRSQFALFSFAIRSQIARTWRWRVLSAQQLQWEPPCAAPCGWIIPRVKAHRPHALLHHLGAAVRLWYVFCTRTAAGQC